MPAEFAPLHVAAAVIYDTAGKILVSRRHAHLHQGDLWEFPGGKVERGESARQALVRELDEELGIRVDSARPLLRVRHRYPDRDVLLDVWRVDGFDGTPHGREGQPLLWLDPDELNDYPFPAANLPIITAARLPDRYLITPEPPEASAWPSFLAQLQRALARGIKLVQFRAPTLESGAYRELAQAVVGCCREGGAQVLLNGAPELLQQVRADGLHLNSRRLMACRERPVGVGQWLAASCHDATQLIKAQAVGVDFAVVSPVCPTTSHPGANVLGWDGLHTFTEQVPVPVYALGGLGVGDLVAAWEHGAQGIAAIRGLWGT